ncbi:unnamed protein product [Cercopithifilaria johnstoni]|uniref:Potassium channel domain-containing protein n=1 Tax=Cercopithifilaria johnstoni TaxID=2874296 RepID=A0A8J2M0S7_9BILA|nr:unnamed protein product [Cercopithifilaria johnstoni]
MLVTWLRSAGSKMGPIFLRILMITAVSIYAVFGALVLSHLETYQIDQFSNFISQNDVIQTSSHMEMMNNSSVEAWPFVDSLLFAFALITTIGYGNITPKTFGGQMFCIFFAAFGVPLTLLTIADLGKFISQINGTNESMEMNDNNEQLNRTLALIVLFIIYVIAGSLLLSSYEPEMPFFTAIYFNFITLTSIGLGDIVPQRRTYMGITILYIIVGLALTTIAIEIAADTLTKLHYFRRTIKNVGDIHIWFGGKRLTVRQLIRNLCDQFNVPDTALSGFNINNFVEQAIKVEAGERLPLRNATSRQEINAGEKNEVSTVVSKPSWTESEIKSEHEPESDHVSEITPISAQELEPEPTPEYESEPEAEEILSCEPTPPHSNSTVTEPTPIIVELEPIPDPESYLLKVSQEMEKIPYLPEIPEPEPMPLIESVPETSEISEATEESDLEQETSAEPENDIAMEKLKDDGVVRRKGYSEEAWKRYQEYQNEWSKFRRLSHTLSRNGHQKRIRKPRIAKLPDFSH